MMTERLRAVMHAAEKLTPEVQDRLAATWEAELLERDWQASADASFMPEHPQGQIFLNADEFLRFLGADDEELASLQTTDDADADI